MDNELVREIKDLIDQKTGALLEFGDVVVQAYFVAISKYGVGFLIKDYEVYMPRPFESVTVRVVGGTSRWFISNFTGMNTGMMWVEMPSHIEKGDGRSYLRTQVFIETFIEIDNERSPISIYDLSAAGCFMRSSREIKDSDIVKVILPIAETDVIAYGNVARKDGSDYGIRFTNTMEVDAIIDRYVLAHLK